MREDVTLMRRSALHSQSREPVFDDEFLPFQFGNTQAVRGKFGFFFLNLLVQVTMLRREFLDMSVKRHCKPPFYLVVRNNRMTNVAGLT
jgi:hypothetical protein